MPLNVRFRRLRIIVPLVLLTMILMRLVWMQLRSYPVVIERRAVAAFDYLREAVDDSCVFVPRTPFSNPPRARASTAAAARMRVSVTRWQVSPAYALLAYVGCKEDALDEGKIVRLNQWVFAATVLLATLMTRFMASSWTVSLIVGAMLLSRGRLLAEIGHISIDGLAGLVVTAWLMACTHFLRTGAAASLAVALVVVVAGAQLDRSLAALALAMPLLLLGGYLWRRRLARPVIRRLRGTSHRLAQRWGPLGGAATWPQDDPEGAVGRLTSSLRWVLGMEFPPPAAAESAGRPNYERGGLFRTITVPFLLWAYPKKRWLRLSLVWLAAGLGAAAMAVGIYLMMAGSDGFAGFGTALAHLDGVERSWLPSWLAATEERFDLHLTTSVLILVMCAWQSPAAGLSSFLECSWLALLGAVLLCVAAGCTDFVDAALTAGLQAAGGRTPDALLGLRPAIAWLEPGLLSLGVAGLYNLMKVVDTRFADKA
jgi:hypothetical protein